MTKFIIINKKMYRVTKEVCERLKTLDNDKRREILDNVILYGEVLFEIEDTYTVWKKLFHRKHFKVILEIPTKLLKGIDRKEFNDQLIERLNAAVSGLIRK